MRKIVFATALAGAVAVCAQYRTSMAESVVRVPAPKVDESPTTAPASETAVLSGGCFWGMQAVFQHVKGVREAISGYTGGAASAAHYDEVSTGTTGHAESIKVVFDPRVVSYGTLLRVYFSVAENPTELDYQGPDQGPQYRGEIWVQNREQRKIAIDYIHQLTADHSFSAPIVTRVDAAMPFYLAERYHQNFATRHPDNPYIASIDAPKLRALAQFFPALYVAKPVLVTRSESRGAAPP